MARASAFQAEGRGFESRFPLFFYATSCTKRMLHFSFLSQVYKACSSIASILLVLCLVTACTPDVSDIEISSNLPGSKVYINDKPVGETPIAIKLVVGSYDIRVEKKGFIYSRTLEIEPNVPMKVYAEFNQTKLEVDADKPYAEIYLDGNLIGTAPYKGVVDAGKHTLKVIKDGSYDYEKTIIFKPFGTVSVFAKLLEHKARIGRYRYPVVRIGRLVWMAENLKEQKVAGTHWDKASGEVFYTWKVARRLVGGSRKWRLPTVDDWKALTRYLGADAVLKLLPGGVSGFGAKPLGFYKGDYGLMLEAGIRAYYWTSTVSIGGVRWADEGGVSFEMRPAKGRYEFYPHDPKLYFLVRYVRDW